MNEPNLNVAKIVLQKPSDKNKLTSLFRQGLRQVIIKMSGKQALPDSKPINDAIQNAKIMVSSYQFIENQDKTTLIITFNAESIGNLLKKEHLATWGNKRPLTLIWLINQNGRLVTTDQQRDQRQLIQNIADSRGLPIMFPDPSEDKNNYRNDSLIDMNNAPLSAPELIKKYASDACLIGRISPDGTSTFIDWQYRDNTQSLNWTSQGDSTAKLITQGIEQLSDTLSDQESTSHNHGLINRYELLVNNITTPKDYANLLISLKASNDIESLQVEKISNYQVKIRLSSLLSLSELDQSIALNPNLVASTLDTSSDSNNALLFDWQA